MPKARNWTFVVFDMTASDFARRVRLHRNLKKQGAAMHTQSVYCAPYTDASFEQLQGLDKDILVIKAEVPSEQIDELVAAYSTYVTKLCSEVRGKIDELEDAKVLASEDAPSKRGYSKRLRKMYERLDHLEYISSLAELCEGLVEDEVRDAVDAFRRRVEHIDRQPPGQFL